VEGRPIDDVETEIKGSCSFSPRADIFTSMALFGGCQQEIKLAGGVKRVSYNERVAYESAIIIRRLPQAHD
jgi:hypothetical protein